MSRSAELAALAAVLLAASAHAQVLKIGDAWVKIEPEGRDGRVVVERAGARVWTSPSWRRPLLEEAPGGFKAGGEVLATDLRGTVHKLAHYSLAPTGVTTGESELRPGDQLVDHIEAALIDERERRFSAALDRLAALKQLDAPPEQRAAARLCGIRCRAQTDSAYDPLPDLERLARELPETPAGAIAADEAHRRRR